MTTDNARTTAPLDPLVRRRLTKKQWEHSHWVMKRYFEILDFRSAVRRRKHKMPQTLLDDLDRLTASLSDALTQTYKRT